MMNLWHGHVIVLHVGASAAAVRRLPALKTGASTNSNGFNLAGARIAGPINRLLTIGFRGYQVRLLDI